MNNYIEQVTSSDNSTNKRKEIIERSNLVDSKYNKLKNSESSTTALITKRKKKQKIR